MALASILLESVARNTAPALAAAATLIARLHGDQAIAQVLASNHEIDAGATYFNCIAKVVPPPRRGGSSPSESRRTSRPPATAISRSVKTSVTAPMRCAAAAFARAPDISVDYAILEKTPIAAVVPSPISWSDLGSWDSVWKTGKLDAAGNVADGSMTVLDTRNSLVTSRDIHVAVIASEDAVYVGRMEDNQNVGKLVKHLASLPKTAELTETHPTSYRPWGGYTSVLNGKRFQVKRLFVTSGKRFSLQKHHHHSEHWIVVRGTAKVTIGEKTIMLHENESVYIPQGEAHRLANPGKIQLELIEVQTGSYLSEDDIIRIEDEFGRG